VLGEQDPAETDESVKASQLQWLPRAVEPAGFPINMSKPLAKLLDKLPVP